MPSVLSEAVANFVGDTALGLTGPWNGVTEGDFDLPMFFFGVDWSFFVGEILDFLLLEGPLASPFLTGDFGGEDADATAGLCETGLFSRAAALVNFFLGVVPAGLPIGGAMSVAIVDTCMSEDCAQHTVNRGRVC